MLSQFEPWSGGRISAGVMACIALLFAVLSSGAQAQSADDYVGLWVGHPYDCYNRQGRLITLSEDVEVTLQNGRMTATKVTGDRCVGAGEVTWYASALPDTIDYGTKYPIKMQVGAPGGSRGWADGYAVFTVDYTIQVVLPGYSSSDGGDAVIFKRKSTRPL